MFYCDPCATKNGWPTWMGFMSNGRCEMCGFQAHCYDMPSRALPLPKKPEPTESLHLEVELPPRPIGTRFVYAPGGLKNPHDAEIVGYHVEHDTDTGVTNVTYRIEYDYIGECMARDVPRATVERALGGEG